MIPSYNHMTCNVWKKIQLSLEYCLLYRRLYIVSPNIPAVKIIADHINADLSTSAAKKYKILFVPRKVGVINALTKARSLFLCLSYKIKYHLLVISISLYGHVEFSSSPYYFKLELHALIHVSAVYMRPSLRRRGCAWPRGD